jgi:hypothetical protein
MNSRVYSDRAGTCRQISALAPGYLLGKII